MLKIVIDVKNVKKCSKVSIICLKRNVGWFYYISWLEINQI